MPNRIREVEIEVYDEQTRVTESQLEENKKELIRKLRTADYQDADEPVAIKEIRTRQDLKQMIFQNIRRQSTLKTDDKEYLLSLLEPNEKKNKQNCKEKKSFEKEESV